MRMEHVALAGIAATFLYFVWRFLRGGSLVGAVLGGSIERECGEIPLRAGGLVSQTLRVYAMKSSGGERFVGVSIVTKATLSAGMTPFKLTYEQAQELARVLTRTCEARDAA